jgi:hypothetical protein
MTGTHQFGRSLAPIKPRHPIREVPRAAEADLATTTRGMEWSSELAGLVSKMPLMEWCIDGHSAILF